MGQKPTFGSEHLDPQDIGRNKTTGSMISNSNELSSHFGGEVDIDVVEDNFMFIEEVIAGYVRDMQDKEVVSDSVDQALNSTKSLSVDEKD